MVLLSFLLWRNGNTTSDLCCTVVKFRQLWYWSQTRTFFVPKFHSKSPHSRRCRYRNSVKLQMRGDNICTRIRQPHRNTQRKPTRPLRHLSYSVLWFLSLVVNVIQFWWSIFCQRYIALHWHWVELLRISNREFQQREMTPSTQQAVPRERTIESSEDGSGEIPLSYSHLSFSCILRISPNWKGQKYSTTGRYYSISTNLGGTIQ